MTSCLRIRQVQFSKYYKPILVAPLGPCWLLFWFCESLQCKMDMVSFAQTSCLERTKIFMSFTKRICSKMINHRWNAPEIIAKGFIQHKHNKCWRIPRNQKKLLIFFSIKLASHFLLSLYHVWLSASLQNCLSGRLQLLSNGDSWISFLSVFKS